MNWGGEKFKGGGSGHLHSGEDIPGQLPFVRHIHVSLIKHVMKMNKIDLLQ